MARISYLLLVLFALGEWIVLAERPDFSQVPGYSEARARIKQLRSEEPSSLQGTEFRNNGIKLDDIGTFLQYRALVKNNVVSLDFEDTVEDVECGLNMMRITQKVTGKEHKFITGEFITASPLWNCGEIGAVYRNITGIVSVDYSFDGKTCVTVVSTNSLTFIDLFERVALNTYETDIAESLANEAKMSTGTENRHSTRDEEVIITEPNQYSQFNSTSNVKVEWVYNVPDQDITLQVYLVEKNGNENPVSNCNWNGLFSQESHEFPSSCFQLNKAYKISLVYNNIEVSSQVFGYKEPSYDHSLNVYEPLWGSSFDSGDTLTVKWEAYKWSSSAKINIYLYKEKTLKDSLLYTKENVLVSDKKFQFTIPSQSTVGSGRGYYIYVGYDCGMVYCSEGFYSKQFALNFDPPFRITNKFDNNTIYFPGFDREVRWDVLKSISKEDITVKLKVDYPSIFPIPDGTITKVKAKAGDRSATLHPKEGSKYPVYYEIAYDCNWFGLGCSTVVSEPFKLIDFNTVRWNQDKDGNVKKEDLEIKSFNCDDMCDKKTDAQLSQFCKACDAGIDMSATASCHNCKAYVRAGFYGMNLEFVGSQVQLFEIGFYGRAELNLSLKLDISAEITKEKIIPLAHFSLSSLGFYIGKVAVGLTLNLNFDIPITFSMKAAVEAVIKTSGTHKVFATAKYGNRIEESKRGVTVYTVSDTNTSSKPTFEFNAYAEATLSAALKVSVVSSFVNVINLTAYGQVIATAHADIKKFNALSTEKLYEKSIDSYGSCLNPHLMEYYIQLSANAHADAYFLFANTPLMEKDYEFPYKYIILSGCLLPWTPTIEEEKTYSLVYNISGLSRSKFSCSDELLNLGIVKDICDTTKWPTGSLTAEVIIGNDNDSSDSNSSESKNTDSSISDSITGINFTLRAIATDGGFTTSSEKELEVKLKEKLSKSNAAFYKGSVGRYFKGKFTDFTLETVVSSSSFTIPSFFLLALAAILVVMF